MSTFTVETSCGTSKDFERRREAERASETHLDLCEACRAEDVRIATRVDGPGTVDERLSEVDAPIADSDETDAERTFDGLPDSILTDPLDVLPDYMIDVVEGQPTINKRGYAVIANHFDIVVQAEAITTAGETDHEYAESGRGPGRSQRVPRTPTPATRRREPPRTGVAWPTT